jgi:gliding motility-associated-like protein
MRILIAHRQFWIAWILAFLSVVNTTAQTGIVVDRDEMHSLGVIEVPGETYLWTIYSDYTLTTQPGTDEVVYLNGRTGPVIDILWKKAGLYYFTVTATGLNGCTNLKVGLVNVNEAMSIFPAIVIAVDKNPICKGERATFTAKVRYEGDNPVYVWTKNGILVGQNRPVYTDNHLVNDDVILCRLTSSEKNARPATVTSEKLVMTVLSIKADFAITGNLGFNEWKVQMINKSEGANRYFWDFGNGYTSGEENPVVTYTQDGNYLIRLISYNRLDCFDTAMYKYDLLFKGLFIPNAFAPTSNVYPANTFKPAGRNLKRYKIEIYDGWGHLLWESDKLDEQGRPAEGWDGTCNGVLMPQGTYMWKVDAQFIDNTIWTGSDIGKGPAKPMGTVTILR